MSMVKVFNHWIRGSTLLELLFDLAFVIVSVVISVMWVTSGLPVDLKVVTMYAAVLALTSLTLNAWLGFYDRIKNRSVYNTVARALLSLYVAAPVAYGLYSLMPTVEISREFLELSVMMATYGMLANRVRALHSARKPMLANRVLIFGIGEKALAVQRSLEKNDPSSQIVGFFPSPVEEAAKVPADQILPATRSLTESAETLKVDEIVVAVGERRGGVMPLSELLDCKLYGVRVLDLATHFEQRLGQIRLDSLRAGWLIFGDGFQQGAYRTAVKRVFDIVCASILLVLALPTMLIAAILIVLESGFPVLYRQERVGLNGRLFNVIKFRSMRTDAEKDGKARWATANDKRVSRVGRVIRKLRIDELPQLFSVLKGDMSLVGPRPERPVFVDQLTREIPFYAVRHSVKPGVTGWAQVRYHYGGSMDGSAKKLQYDLYYVKNHSLFLDLVILFETIGVVLTAKGAQ